ncbi:MAG: substrate-binding domain-containing protein [Kiritimatiellae bacterium]|nr:substrate-binding domain-containing protein [Kiritimatiellia bacterium]
MDDKSNDIKRVAVVLDLAKASRRDFLSGFFDRVNSIPNWKIRLFQSADEFTPATVCRWQTDGTRGVIVAENGSAGADAALALTDIPVVAVGSRTNWLTSRRQNIVFLRMDDERIGEFAAGQLAELGRFNSVAYLPAGQNDLWNILRQRGFCAGTAKRNYTVWTYDEKADGPLEVYLDKLPKPAAIFAACDGIASSVIDALPAPAAAIPGRIVLLGVDDDELICESSRPRLSSIRPDHYTEGSLAAGELDALMRARSPKMPKTILCREMKLVTRDSTAPVAPAARLISKANEFIRHNAARGITPADVAAHLGISRRLLDLRFSELNDRTVAESILDTKLEAVKRALSTSGDRMSVIAANCGFSNPNHLRNVFLAKTGLSMRDWRKSHPADRN